jgi:hypothetical protein
MTGKAYDDLTATQVQQIPAVTSTPNEAAMP